MITMSEYIDGLPNICGQEELIEQNIRNRSGEPLFKDSGKIDFDSIKSACAIALHMHQPLIPVGGDDLQSAAVISNLQHMMEHPGIGDNHNAQVFAWCYRRMGEFIPELVEEGKNPRVMLEYSGTLLHGLRRMGADDVIESLKLITCDPRYRHTTEWLGAPWGHAVAPSTPVQDFRLHVKAWQHHFAAIFGLEALSRVRGFSPSEMALPNHPDVAYEYVKTLKECGYTWVLIQEHTVEESQSGTTPSRSHIPHRLLCTNSDGKTVSIIAIIKTQGSDTKLVAQMQPCYEAQSLSRWEINGKSVPPLVTQIADGENGGVMMNEFPPKYKEVVALSSWSDTPMMNVTEYLEHLFAMGIEESDLPTLQPIFQKRIWERFTPGGGKERLEQTIESLKQEDGRFHMEGGSWTNDLSWVKGYGDVLGPMEEASSLFYEQVLQKGITPSDPCYRNALFHLMCSETSCFRYWGEGLWTDYGKEFIRRTKEIIRHDCS
ncbi:MAG: glycosyl hydrolase family 57 [Campylobacterota bacterium]|nr:glycosyl hydrolase family 57 [Campylobacterota bacterium]